MADAFHIGFDQPTLGGVLPVPEHPFEDAPAAAPERANPTDPDWSNVPEARSTTRADGEVPPAPGSSLWDRLNVHTGPQEAPKPDGTDITGSMAGVPTKPDEPKPTAPAPGSTAPDAAGLPTPPPAVPVPQRPLTADEQMQEWLHPTTDEGKQQKADLDNVVAQAKAAWENDKLIFFHQEAESEAVGAIISGAKAKLGVTLEDPTHGGYHDEAVARVISQAQYQSSGRYFDPNNPEGFFGGGAAYKAAVQKAQMDIFDEKRQALAEKIKGDQAYDRAGENSDALAILAADTPGPMLAAKQSREANVSAAAAEQNVDSPLVRAVTSFVGGQFGGLGSPVNDAALMFGAGLEPTLAKMYFPLKSKIFKVISDVTEGGVRQAAINMGLTGILAPAQQAANEERGEDHGLVPFLHDLEDSGLSGFIPGALIHGVKALDLLHGIDARPWIDEFIREVKRQSAAEQHETFLKDAAATPHDPTQAEGPPAGPQYPPETATDPAAREEIIKKSRTFMDAVHAYEQMRGLEPGSTYANVGRNRPPPGGGSAPPPPPGTEPPQEPPRGGGPTGGAGGADAAEAASDVPRLGGPRKLLTGPDFPKSPDLSDAARNRPSPSSITPAAIAKAEADHAALPPRMPGVPPSEHLRTFIEALRHGEAPDVFPPPEPPMSAPPARDANFLPPDHLPELATAPGEPAGKGIVHRTSGYEGPHEDLLQNRIEHLQRRVQDESVPPKVRDELQDRIRGFSRHVLDREEKIASGVIPPERAKMLRNMQPGDVITGINDEGDKVTGEISGWLRRSVMVRDADDISHYVPIESITKLIKGARGGQVNMVPHMKVGEEFAHRGKPVTNGISFKARDLKTDAATYQYKAGGDANGVTERLSTVKKWDPLSVGNIVVHQRLDGEKYVVDGHQRTGLAKRIMDADGNHAPISIPGFLFKEADGWTPQEVRAIAAAKNIREGLGDTFDIARVLRDEPELWDDSLPIGRGDMKEARGLANLSDEAWVVALNTGKPRRDYASFVGNMAEDKSTHLAIIDDLIKYNPKTQNEARMIIADAMQAGFNKSEQVDLFGPSEVTTSLRGERSKVYSAAEKLLQDDKKIFGMLEAEAPRIIEAGNVLADTNAERADRAGQLAQGLIALAQRAGPISSALNRAAQRVADGEHPKTAARTFLNELPALLNQEGLRVADVPTAPKYDLDQPKAREEQVRDLDAEFMATQPGFFAEPPKTAEEQRAAIAADVKQKLLDAGIPEVQAERNGELWAARYATRAARMGRSDPEQMYREAGMVVRGDAQREAEIAGEAPGGRTLNQAATVPTFYSAVERAVTGAKQAKASPEQWLSTIRNMPGIKTEEMDWLGLPQWLREQKGPVTRADVADYVRANSIQIHEVTHADADGAVSGYEAEVARGWLDRHGGDATEAERAYIEASDRNPAGSDPEVIAAIRQPPASPTKFKQYSLKGGENYRELLLTLPSKGREVLDPDHVVPSETVAARHQKTWDDLNRWISELQSKREPLTEGEESRLRTWEEDREALHGRMVAETIEEKGPQAEPYKSSHWDEPNVVAHVRYDDRTVDGKRALHVAEIQSDYAQDKRRGKNVPDAPYIGSTDSWTTLSLKRMIRKAAEDGYDLLTWDTGATNAERYGLEKQIKSLVLKTEGDDHYLEAWNHNDDNVFMRKVTPEEMTGIVGKEVADRLIGSEPVRKENGFDVRELSGLDLKVGGEGMAGFYDRIIPAAVSKLTKKFGGKVTTEEMPVASERDRYTGPNLTREQLLEIANDESAPDQVRSSARAVRAEMGRFGEPFKNMMENFWAKELAEHVGGKLEPEVAPTKIHALAITPQLRDAAVNEGFPLFHGAAGGEEPRASITIRDNGAVVDLFSKANASSFPHESAHLWLKELGEDAAHPDAPQQIKDDFQTVLDWLGAKDAASITDEQHEKWARGFEQYLRSGKAPSSALARAFEQFKEWLKAIYRTLRGLGKEIPDSIRAVMDRMLATDEEIAARRAETERTQAAAPKATEAATPAEPAPRASAPAVITDDPLIDRITSDAYVSSAITDPVINRANDVPYGAGPNKANDRVVNIDRHVPKTDTIKGVKYDPARAVAVHEQVEKHALDQLTAAGIPEAQAYEVAHFVFAEPAERAWVEQNVGPNAWNLYQKHWDKWLAPIDHENPANPPPDLYQKPYPHDDDHLAPEDRGSDKKFEETGHHNLPELRAIAEKVFGDRGAETERAGAPAATTEPAEVVPPADATPPFITKAIDDAITAAKASPEPLEQQIGQILEEEIRPLAEPAPAEADTNSPAAIIANIPQALQGGSIDAKRFSSAPTTAEINEIIEKGRAHEDVEVDRLFGADAANVKKWLRSSSDKANEKLQDLVDEKYGAGSPQEGLIFGAGDTPIVNVDSLKALRDTIEHVEGEVEAAAAGDDKMLPRELAWLAPKLPAADKAPEAHTEAERIALLGLARAFEDMRAKGVDAEKILRQAVAYTGQRVSGDADDARTLMEKIVPYTRQFMEESGAEPPPAAEPAPALAAPPPDVPESAQNHANDLAGRVAYHNGDLALVQGFSALTGKPVYVGAKGDLRARHDIETDKTTLFTPAERAELVAAKRAAVAADEAAHAANPDGPFAGGKTFAASPSVPENLASFAKGLIDLVGIKERVYLTTVEDARAADDLHGPFAAIRSAGVDSGTFGTTRRLPNGDHYIAISVRPSEQLNVETVSHEVGHIVEKTSWLNAPPEVKAAVDAEYEKWRDAQRAPGVKARDLIRSTRTPETAETITLPDEALSASDLNRRDSYWTAKDEWFADQVARWATSSKKPMTLVDKFFASIAALLRKIHEALGNAFKPVKSMKDWLDSLSPTEIERDERAAPREPSAAERREKADAAFKANEPAYQRALQDFRAGKMKDKEYLALRKKRDALLEAWNQADNALRDEKPTAAEAGPEGTQQTLMPGVNPVRDADRMRLMAGKPLRGGNRELPAGGLFDDGARAQTDIFDMYPTGDGLISRSEMEARVASRSEGGGAGAQESQGSAGGAPRDFEDYVRDMAGNGQLDPDDADAIIEKYRDDMKRKSPSRARTEGEKAAEFKKIEKARRDMLGAKARDIVVKNLMSYRTPHGAADMIEAAFNHWEGFGHGGFPGVKQRLEAMQTLVRMKMSPVMETFRRTGISGRRTSSPLLSDVLHPSEIRKRMQELVAESDIRKAGYGEKVSPKAQALYNAFDDTSDTMRQMFNELGGAIPKRSGGYFPQTHNEAAIARSFNSKDVNDARPKWSKYINSGMGWQSMFDPITGELFSKDLSEERKMAILGHVFDSIITSGDIDIRPSSTPRGRGAIASQRMDHKFLVFKDAAFADEYDRQFGTNGAFIQMMDHLNSMSHDIAIMQVFGPNPSAVHEYMKELIRHEGAKAAAGHTHMLRGVTQANAIQKAAEACDRLDNYYEQYRGDRPARNKLALAGQISRNVTTSALLGASAIPHATSNWYLQTLARKIAGIPAAKVIPNLLRALVGRATHEEMLRAGLDIENGQFNIGGGAEQLSNWQKIANWSSWLPDRTTHWFGLIPIVEANKAAFFRGVMSYLADIQKTDWRDLPERIKSKMAGYGISERDWRVMQVAAPYKPAVGSAPWLRPNEVMAAHEQADGTERVLAAHGRSMSVTRGRRISDNGGPSLDPTDDDKEAAKITREVGLKMLAFMHGEREIAVPQNSMRARAMIFGSSRAGTWPGEIRRSFGLFKSFVGSMMVSQSHTIWAENARGRWHGAAYKAAIIAGMTLAGMASLQLKQMAAGKDPAPMDLTTMSGLITWMRAALTSSSFGIFGEFLASDHSSFGIGPLETAAGPVVGQALAGMEWVKDQFTHRATGVSKEPFGVDLANALLKFARANTPVLSTGWPVRAAFNRILDAVQRSYDRNAYHKQRLQEERLMKDTGQRYFWRPGNMLPDRLPQLTHGR